MSKSEIYGQLSIFDLVEDNGFCWDSDINEIYKKIEDISKKYNLPMSRAEWRIWEHVPNLGYRMSITLEIKRCQLTSELGEALAHVVDFASERNIELSPINPYYFDLDDNPNESRHMYIYSMFKDKARQKRR